MAFLDETGLAELWSIIGDKYGIYHDYWWKRRIYLEKWVATKGTATTCKFGGSAYVSIYYADSYTTDENGYATLVDPVCLISNQRPDIFDVSSTIVPANKYILNATSCGVPSGGSINTLCYTTSQTTLGSDYTYYGYFTISKACPIKHTYEITMGEWEHVHSENRNAYSDLGVVDGYEYNYLGVPYENAVSATEIATGSYEGTGTYGSSNPCSLTFDFIPQILIVAISDGSALGGHNWVRGCKYGAVNSSYNVTLTWDGYTVSWYNTDGTSPQLNTSGYTYNYIAIG